MDLKQIAVGRLMLDNFPHIKSYWQMVSPKMAQISLRFGADDIDGTVIEEKIYHDAGATTPQGMRRRDLDAADHRGRARAVRAGHAVSGGDAQRGQLHGRGLGHSASRGRYKLLRDGNLHS